MPTSALAILLRANMWSQRWRVAAATCAIACAGSVLLSSLLGMQLLKGQAPRAGEALLGNVAVHVAAGDSTYPYLDAQLLDDLRADPRVENVATAVSVRAVDMAGTEGGDLDRERFFSLSTGGMGGWIPGRRDNYMAWEAGGPRGELVEGRWPAEDAIDPIEIVAPAVWGHKIGDWRRLESDGGVYRARIVGIVGGDMSLVSTPQGVRLSSRQISPRAAERLAGSARRPGDARVTLRDGSDRADFVKEWRERSAPLPGRIEVWDAEPIRSEGLNSPGLSSARMAVITAILLSAATVACIALGVQGNAVRERAAQLTLLRALGAAGGTLAALVFSEAALLAAFGLAGAVAVTWAMLAGLGVILSFLGIPGAPDALSILLTGVVIFLSVLAGGVWPAWVASRTRPAEVAAATSDPTQAARLARIAALLGIATACAALAAILAMPANSILRAQIAGWVGIPAVAFAAICIAPLSIRLVGKVFTYPVAWITRTDSLILSDQIAGDGARSAGSVVAMSVGLGGFFWLLCWGASMLGSFVIDPQVPRWLISIHPYGLEQRECETILAQPGFREFQPLTLVDTRLAGEGVQDAVPTLVMGIDASRAFEDAATALPFHFLTGDRTKAIEQLSRGGFCLLSDWYADSAGVVVGDELKVAVPGDGRAVRTYRVAAVVDLSGWRMMTKQNKVRLRGDKHRAMVVLAADVARRDFPVAYANYLLGNTTVPGSDARSAFRSDLPKDDAFAASNDQRAELEDRIAQIIDLDRPIDFRPDGGDEVRTNHRVVQVDDLQRTSYELMGDWGGGIVRRMGLIPLFILSLSLFSICGTLTASFRARARELGILRSCGLTRFGVARLAVAESLLLGLAAIPVAAFVGAAGAWIMLEIASVVGYRLDFAGIKPEFTVPWAWLSPGWIATAIVCGLAALWAGWRVGRIPPATLITSGANAA